MPLVWEECNWLSPISLKLETVAKKKKRETESCEPSHDNSRLIFQKLSQNCTVLGGLTIMFVYSVSQ